MFTKLATKVETQEVRLPYLVLVEIRNIAVRQIGSKIISNVRYLE